MRRTCGLVVIAALFAPAAPVWAQADVLQVVPDDAVAFVLVNRLGQTNDKITALAKRLKMDLPGSPLEMIKGAVGAEKGLAPKGSFAIAAFAGEDESDKPRPLIYVPVTDYQAFIDQLQPEDASEGISKITAKNGKAMLAGKRGNYAILAGSEDRAVLQRALKAKKSLATWAEPLTGWLAENDGAAVLTGHGIKLVSAKARQGLEAAKQNLGNLPPEAAQLVGKFFDAAENFFKSVETDVSYAGLAIRLDQGGSLHVNARASFQQGSGFARAGAKVSAPPGGPVAGLPSGPFVFALGGTLPKDGMQGIVRMNLEMMKAGGQNIPEESLKKLEKVYLQMLTGMSAMSMVLQVGKENQPVLANFAAAIQIKNATAYMAEYEKSIAVMNEVVKELNLPFLPTYEVKKVTVSGKPALQLSADFAAALGVPEEMQKMMQSLFGPDGKMTISVAARDDKTIVMRYTGAQGLKGLLDGKDKGLSSDPGVVQATKALPAGAQWALYLSPKGTTEFANRMVKAFSPFPLEVPSFPATPPVAIGARISAESFEVHVVIPSGVLDNAGEYGQQLKRMFQGGV
jgi:hypothetical protein